LRKQHKLFHVINKHFPARNHVRNPCQPDQFEIYKSSNLNQTEIVNKTLRLVDSEYTHDIIWDKYNRLSFRKEINSKTKYIAELDTLGKIQNKKAIENWFPNHFGYNGNFICIDEDNKELKLINEKSH